MSVAFIIRGTQREGSTSLYVGVKTSDLNIRVATPLKVDIVTYKADKRGIYADTYTNTKKKAEHRIYTQAMDIKARIENTITDEGTITKDRVVAIIAEVCFAEDRRKNREIEEERLKEEERRRAAEEEANRVTLQRYLNTYIERIKSGDILTKSDKRFSDYTIKSLKYSIHVFNDYQAERGFLDFDTITPNTFEDYKKWMVKGGYAEGAIGARVKDIKAILARAQSEGYHDNRSYEKIQVSKPTKDSIYLTEEELNAITNVNPKDFPDVFPNPDQAERFRDVFLIGALCGQRISDYGHIQRDDIFDAVINGTKRTYIRFKQQKTGKVVVIPCKPQLEELIRKYDYNLPQVKFEQMLNRCMPLALKGYRS